MLTNKKKDMTPFDMSRKPVKQKWYLMPLVWFGSFFMTRQFHLKITKSMDKELKPPYLVIATHQGFSDYYIAPLALFPHRANYVSDMEGFAAFGDWLYRAIGCIGKRRYVSDISVVKNIFHGLQKKQIVVIYPESRHSNVGTTSYIPKNLGKLVKMTKVPLVILSAHGSYLANPFWDEERTRKTPMSAHLESVYTAEEIAHLSAEEIQRTIEEKLAYDEYGWQQDNHIAIKETFRAEGLHKALYQCISCGRENAMQSKGSTLTCTHCNRSWELNEEGYLEDMNMTDSTPLSSKEATGKKIHIPHWYETQRENVIHELQSNDYSATYKVRVEALPNAKGFVLLGEGTLTLDKECFTLTCGDTCLTFPHAIRESVQTEYNYRGRGMAIVLSTKDCCYYIYGTEPHFQPTKLQFIGEYYYRLAYCAD